MAGRFAPAEGSLNETCIDLKAALAKV